MPVKIWSPRLWGAHLLALVLLAGTIGLGLWQLGTWRDHRTEQRQDATSAPAKPLTDVMGSDDPFPGLMTGHPVTFSGVWVPGGTVYVSGRERGGYWVVTPVAVGGTGRPAMPVVRGWSKSLADVPAPPTGNVHITGWLQPPEGSTGISDDDPTDDVLPQLRIADLVQHVDQDLYGGYVVDRHPTDGLRRAALAELPGAGTFTGLRNFLYALEWWVFAGFVVYIWWKHVQEVTGVSTSSTTADGSIPAGDSAAPGEGGESRTDDHVPSGA